MTAVALLPTQHAKPAAATSRPSSSSLSSSISLVGRRTTLILIIKVILYVTTGILQPLLIDTLRLKSCLGRKALLLPTLANTLGMACCCLLTTSSDWTTLRARYRADDAFRRGLFTAAFVDLMSGMMLTGGILLTGGAVFVVLYNSCPAWTALLSKYFLGRRLSLRQTVGVALVCVGLVVNVLGTAEQLRGGGGEGDGGQSTSKFATVMAGSIVVLVGSILHSAFFVISDRWLRGAVVVADCGRGVGCHGHDDGARGNGTAGGGAVVSPPLWSCCLGSMESTFMGLWVLTAIRWGGFHDGGEQQSDAASPFCPAQDFATGFAALLLVDAIHAAAFFLLLKQIGAVGSALLKGIQAVAVVLLSAAFLCAPGEEAQCLTVTKAVSIVIVVSGTVCYAVGHGDIVGGGAARPAFGNNDGSTNKIGRTRDEEPPSMKLEGLLT